MFKNIHYIFHSKKLLIQLVKRGYNYFKLKRLAFNIGLIPRFELIGYKSKSVIKDRNRKWISLFQVYDDSLKFMKKTLFNAFKKN